MSEILVLSLEIVLQNLFSVENTRLTSQHAAYV